MINFLSVLLFPLTDDKLFICFIVSPDWWYTFYLFYCFPWLQYVRDKNPQEPKSLRSLLRVDQKSPQELLESGAES